MPSRSYLVRCEWPGCPLRELVSESPSACAEIGDAVTGHLLAEPTHRVVVALGWAGHKAGRVAVAIGAPLRPLRPLRPSQ